MKCCSFQPAISAEETTVSNKVEIQINSFNSLKKEWPKYKRQSIYCNASVIDLLLCHGRALLLRPLVGSRNAAYSYLQQSQSLQFNFKKIWLADRELVSTVVIL